MADTIDSLIVGLQSYIVAPLNAFGLGGFVFDVQGEARATLSNEITDHYTEDNIAVQDHIAVKPKRITLKGYVGELVYGSSSGALSTLQTLTQKLTTVSAFLPQLSAAATQAQDAIANPENSSLTLNSISGLIPGAANIYGLVKNLLGANGNMAKQQNAYNYFDACRQQGILMGIQTPWEFLTNMAIETIEAIQTEDSIFVSDFSVTYKQIRIVSSQIAAQLLSGTGGTVPSGIVSGFGANAVQTQTTNNIGVVPGQTLPSPLLPGIQGSIVSAANLANSGLSAIFRFK